MKLGRFTHRLLRKGLTDERLCNLEEDSFRHVLMRSHGNATLILEWLPILSVYRYTSWGTSLRSTRLLHQDMYSTRGPPTGRLLDRHGNLVTSCRAQKLP